MIETPKLPAPAVLTLITTLDWRIGGAQNAAILPAAGRRAGARP